MKLAHIFCGRIEIKRESLLRCFFFVGILLVIGCVFGGYSVHGDLRILWQPIEYVIILGGALGAFMAGNPKRVVIASFKSVGTMVKGPKYMKEAYVELLTCL